MMEYGIYSYQKYISDMNEMGSNFRCIFIVDSDLVYGKNNFFNKSKNFGICFKELFWIDEFDFLRVLGIYFFILQLIKFVLYLLLSRGDDSYGETYYYRRRT